MNTITIQTTINAPLAKVWECWNDPKHITQWAFASDDWEAPEAENDVRVGGVFRTRMSAKDGSASFDFGGTYTRVDENAHIGYTMDDGRKVSVDFAETPEGIQIIQTFDPENENPEDTQRTGWQAILDNFKSYVERE